MKIGKQPAALSIPGNAGERKPAMKDTLMEKYEKPDLEKYEKPDLEVVEIRDNVILTSEEPVTPCRCNIGLGF